MAVATLTRQLQMFPVGAIPPGKGITAMPSFHALCQTAFLEVLGAPCASCYGVLIAGAPLAAASLMVSSAFTTLSYLPGILVEE